jgi:hypothetical protein
MKEVWILRKNKQDDENDQFVLVFDNIGPLLEYVGCQKMELYSGELSVSGSVIVFDKCGVLYRASRHMVID